MIKFGAAAVGVVLSVMVLPVATQARPVGTVEGMPFFALPYPYGYVYHRPRIECYDIQEVYTPDGPKIQEIWTCDGHVTAKY